MNIAQADDLLRRATALEILGRQLVEKAHALADPNKDIDSDWDRPSNLFEIDTEKYGTIRIEQWPHALRVWIGGNLVYEIEDPSPQMYSLDDLDCPF
jgi:hypothetical protein